MAQDEKKFGYGSLTAWEDVIICTKAPDEYTEHGVALSAESANDASKQPLKGIVFAVGPSSDPKKKIDIHIGDMLFYERYTANVIQDKGIEYNFVRFKFIMGYKRKEEVK